LSFSFINAQTTKKTQTQKKEATSNNKILKDKKGEIKDSAKSETVSKTQTSAKSTKNSVKPTKDTSKSTAKDSTKSKTTKPKTENSQAKSTQTEEKPNLFDESLRIETGQNISRDDINGEDLEVRNAALNALGKEAGTVVVMEPQTGKVLSIVNQDWAIRKTFKPCSTIKLVTAVASIKEKVIDEKGNIKNYDFPMDLTDALAYSNNAYFQLAGANLGQRKFFTYAHALGLGEPTGINSENEASGKIPNYKFGSEINRSYSHGDDFEVTAVQLATVVSAITNGGRIVVPQIPKERTENASFVGYMKRELNLPKETLQSVIPGMIGSVNYGTAQNSFEPTLNVAGKTGSCIADGTWIGLFASVSSAINPKLAVVVITNGSKARGSKSAEIASKVYSFLAYRLRETPESTANNEIYLNPTPKVSPKISFKLDTAKSDDSDEKTSDDSARKSFETIKASFNSKSKKNLVSNQRNETPTSNTSNPTNTSHVNNSVRPRIVTNKN
jgi:membrane peptidoglycan carboxypeptidase